MRMAGHADELDRLPVGGLLAHDDADIDAARIVAGGGVFVAIAVADHLEQIAILEGIQRLDGIDFLQADDIGARRGDGQRGCWRVSSVSEMARALSNARYSASSRTS